MSSPAHSPAGPSTTSDAAPRSAGRLPASMVFFALLVVALFATEAAFFAVAFSMPSDRLEIPASR